MWTLPFSFVRRLRPRSTGSHSALPLISSAISAGPWTLSWSRDRQTQQTRRIQSVDPCALFVAHRQLGDRVEH